MSHSVVWSPEAEISYAHILDFIINTQGTKVLNNFMDRTEELISYVSQNPLQYIYSKKHNAYRAVVTKQVSLYYRIHSTQVELLVFWDTRQDPEKLRV